MTTGTGSPPDFYGRGKTSLGFRSFKGETWGGNSGEGRRNSDSTNKTRHKEGEVQVGWMGTVPYWGRGTEITGWGMYLRRENGGLIPPRDT